MDKVVHFEIPADDLERAKKFYKSTFGWNVEDVPDMDYIMVRTVEVDEERMPKEKGAINGGIMKRDKLLRSPVITINVKNIDTALEVIKKNRGKAEGEKTTVIDMGFSAYVRDTEGNIIGLWENKE
jgi:hypothetical protein